MKQMKTLLHHIRQFCALKGRKAGSSLGMVMIIGTALVIWVMAIMPLMTTTGTTAIQTQGKQDDYLVARSSVEFSKSELEKIVETQNPYTFAVIKDGEKYKAIAKKGDAGGTNSEYTSYVAIDTDDMKDVPLNTEAGNEVTAICAVKATSTNKFDIVITTYTNGSENLKYTATFTSVGKLKLYPESYKQGEALPLSDFVLVDGILGDNTVWNAEVEKKYTTVWFTQVFSKFETVKETLLPFYLDTNSDDSEESEEAEEENKESYADAGQYPAVFKTVAQAAMNDGSFQLNLIEKEQVTNEHWIMPFASTKEEALSAGKEGAVWLKQSGNSIKIYIAVKNSEGVLAEQELNAEIYYNGVKNPVLKESHSYTISIDYAGTGSAYDKEKINILPVQGLVLGSYTYDVSKATQAVAGEFEISSIQKVAEGYLVKVIDARGSVSGFKVGYTADENGKDITWVDGGEFVLKENKVHYLFAYRPATLSDGVFYKASDVRYVGMVFPSQAEKLLQHQQDYFVIAEKNERFYALAGSLKAVEQDDTYDVNDGMLFINTTTDDQLVWNMQMTDSTNANSSWQFTQKISEDVTRYLAMRQNTELKKVGNQWRWVYTYMLSTDSYNNVNQVQTNNRFTVKVDESTREGVVFKQYNEDRKQLNRYLGYESGNSFGALTDPQNVYFVKAPVVPAVDVSKIEVPELQNKNEHYTVSYPHSTASDIYNLVGVSSEDTKLYTNGNEFVSGTLDSGTYTLIGRKAIKDEAGNIGSYAYYSLGTLQVEQAKQIISAEEVNLTMVQDETDDMVVYLSVDSCPDNENDDDDDIRYFAYKATDAEEYQWFAVRGGSSFTLKLLYGSYDFAFKQSGSLNYTESDIVSITNKKVIASEINYLTGDEYNDFWFVMGEIDGKPEALWYQFPEVPEGYDEQEITPSRITMYYGVPKAGSLTEIIWYKEYPEDQTNNPVRYYAATIAGTRYNSINNLYRFHQGQLKLTAENGHLASIIKGSSIYFMGEEDNRGAGAAVGSGACIETWGNDVYVNADLLVVSGQIASSGASGREGRVIVTPYDSQPDKKVLVFFTNEVQKGSITFAARNFYLVDAGTDLNHPYSDDIQAISWDQAKEFFIYDQYPSINLDIAYAVKDQLDLIVSSETTGWTGGGELKGSSSQDYVKYAVCTFIDKMSNSTSADYTANRILIAAKDEAGADRLTVPQRVTFTSRYLSLDVGELKQQNNAGFYVRSLGQDSGFIGIILEGLDLYNYSSKTLQVEYERDTLISASGASSITRPQQIARHEDNVNLFNTTLTNSPLLVDYTEAEIEDLYEESLWGLVKTRYAKTQNRYIRISTGSESHGSVDFQTEDRFILYLYANYVCIDPTIDGIYVNSSNTSTEKVLINSQEQGYDQKEYLGWFNQSEEGYSGTIVYVVPDGRTGKLKVGKNRSDCVEIDSGFYFVPTTEDGTNLMDLAPDKLGKNPDEEGYNAALKKPYKIDPTTLAEYSIYVNQDGSLSNNAYIELDIYDSNSAGVGGFSGGMVN